MTGHRAGFLVGIASSLVATLLWLLASKVHVNSLAIEITLGLLAVVATGSTVCLLRTRPRGVSGRKVFMAANLRALKRETGRSGSGLRVCTTRFSNWDTTELSEERALLRMQNDLAAERGLPLSRIHNLRSEADREKLHYELKRYAGHKNVSVRALFDVDHRLIPELIVTSDYAAIGPAGLDGLMKAGFVYQDRVSIEAVHEYFFSLWAVAEPVLVDGAIDASGLDSITTWRPSS